MKRYRNRRDHVVVTLPDDHSVELGADWVEVEDEVKTVTPTKARAVTKK